MNIIIENSQVEAMSVHDSLLLLVLLLGCTSLRVTIADIDGHYGDTESPFSEREREH